MNCQKVDNLLSAYIDREVSPDESRAIWLHLEDCLICRELYVQLCHSKEALAFLQEVELPSDFHAQILAALEGPKEQFFSSWLIRFKPLVYACALGVLFAVIGFPLTQGDQIAKVDPLSDLQFLIAEHKRAQFSEPFNHLVPPVSRVETNFIVSAPATLNEYFSTAVVSASSVSGKTILSHHF